MNTFTRGELVFDVTDLGPAEGEVVVLLHGFPQNRHSWAGVAPQLAEAGYRVLAPDQRGYSPGARPQGRRAYGTAELVNDVVALVDAGGVDKVHIVGHDWGALVAWAFASAHADRLHSLTAVSVPHPGAFLAAMPRGQLLKSWYMAVFQIPKLAERLIVSDRGVALIGGHGLTPAQVRGYLDPLGSDGLTAALNWYRALPVARGGKEYQRKSRVPTLYVWSDGDAALGRAGAVGTEKYVTGPYRFEIFEGVSHWIPDEVPDRFAELLLTHVRTYRPPAG
ncbi:MAG: alpha/beta fold hydrolase [Actinomycetota bacterium]|nr:alpha/beta fold hydrolase [Actinomycetota bacterium]